jgi:PKD repeat protein
LDDGVYCDAEYCTDVEIAECEADFEYESEDLELSFSEIAYGVVTEYSWDFGDGGTSDSPNPNHEYASAGTYLVCLTIITASGCTDDFCIEVIVNEPGADCFTEFTHTTSGTSLTFTAVTDPGALDVLSYTWEFGDGAIGDGEISTHDYATAGTYEACLTVIFTDSCIAEFCTEISVPEATDCNASFSYEADILTVSFFESATGDVIEYIWDFGDGSTSAEANPVHVYSFEGSYPACLTVVTVDGCEDDICLTVIIGEPSSGGDCEAGFEYEINGLTVTFFETADGGGSDILSYIWTFGDGFSFTGTEAEHTFADTTSYEVCLTIVTLDSCINMYCDSITLIDNDVAIEEENIFGVVSIHPNPANDETTISYTLNAASEITISLADVTGRNLAYIYTGNSMAGTNKFNLNTTAFAAGIYMVNVSSGSYLVTQKLIITK